jgi:putative transposase
MISFSCRRQEGIVYAGSMVLRGTSHAVCDTKYHLVWAPKYRKWILRGDLQVRVEEIFDEIAWGHGFVIEALEVSADHVHVFSSFPRGIAWPGWWGYSRASAPAGFFGNTRRSESIFGAVSFGKTDILFAPRGDKVNGRHHQKIHLSITANTRHHPSNQN